jgi:hypothetical protein
MRKTRITNRVGGSIRYNLKAGTLKGIFNRLKKMEIKK